MTTPQSTLSQAQIHELREALTAQILQELHKTWQPHESQARILNSLFYKGTKDVYVECGRKFGKTETAVYFLVRHALLHANSSNYYIAPVQKQGKEILWSTGRIQRFIPAAFIAAVNNTEMRVTLTNGSFIKLDGSDYDPNLYRGVEPHALVADEIAQHDAKFWSAMQPNRAVHDAPLLVIGTPPEHEGFATELKDTFLKSSRAEYFNFTSFANPHISHSWLYSEKDRLFANGEEDVWYREYEAKFVRGGKNAIFPMLNETKHRRPFGEVMSGLLRDRSRLQWYCIADPGSASVFAVLFAAYNPYTQKWYNVDEIYEDRQSETSASKIRDRIEAKVLELAPDGEWNFIYDEAAAWFATEMANLPDPRPWVPTQKAVMKRDPHTKEPWGLSLMKDMLRYDKAVITDRCPKLWWEAVNYTRAYTRAGDIKIYKRNDHEIDCWRYGIFAAGLSTIEVPLPPPPEAPIRVLTKSINEELFADVGWASEPLDYGS